MTRVRQEGCKESMFALYSSHKVITCQSVFLFERQKYLPKVLKSVIECLINKIIYNWGSDWIFNIIRDWEALDSLKCFFFSAQKGVAQPCLRLPFGVGYYVCLGPTGDANVASPAVFWPRFSRLKCWNNFFDMKEAEWQNLLHSK